MQTKKTLKIANIPKKTDPDPLNIRASISFPKKDYMRLEELASEKRVSLAWMVREAVRAYLQNQNNVSRDDNHDKSL